MFEAECFILCIGDQFKESLNTLNQYSESPVHVAIRLSQEKVLGLLIEKGANCRLLCGQMYAIHLALKNKSYGCAILLINQDNICVHDKDLKYGAFPLHWAKTSQVLSWLIIKTILVTITMHIFFFSKTIYNECLKKFFLPKF